MKNLTIFGHISVLLLVASVQRAVSAAEVSGSIADQVWTQADSPVRVTADLFVASLTVMPGVVVEFAGNYSVTVNGILRIVGTQESPVLLRPARDNTTGWQGISFENTKPGSEFQWVRFEGAKNGAVRLVRSNPTFRNCTFADNGSDGSGGAVSADLVDGDLVVTGCHFLRNSAKVSGGAVSADLVNGNLVVAGCHFLRNSAKVSGGAISAILKAATLVVSDCNFTENVADPGQKAQNTPGGAVTVQGNSDVTRSTFSKNQARAYTYWAASGVYAMGGALCTQKGHCQITACAFFENACTMTAESQTPDISWPSGGAVYLDSGSMKIQNCVLARNTLSAVRRKILRGSAVFLNAGDCFIVNSTLVGNTGDAAIHNAGGTVNVLNSIVYWNNDHGRQISSDPAAVTIAYSDIEGGSVGENVIEFNPAVDPTSNYRILAGSPAIDAGCPDPEYNDTHFPPSLGAARNDMGFLGGPKAFLWLAEVEPAKNEVPGLETGTYVTWPNRTGIHLECAIGPNGPWQPYEGEALIMGNKRVVLVDGLSPWKFFRLVQD